jgi:hypothetical protein
LGKFIRKVANSDLTEGGIKWRGSPAPCGNIGMEREAIAGSREILGGEDQAVSGRDWSPHMGVGMASSK